MSTESQASKLGTTSRAARIAAVLACALVLAGTACGEGPTGGGQGSSDAGSKQSAASGSASEERKAPAGEGAGAETTASGGAGSEEAELARAEVGDREISNMLPADGKKPDEARPLPENPPGGIEVYPATTNRTIRGPIEYRRAPPTNGDHDPLWQNCGFYEKPIRDRHAVHSMDHGVVWITYRPHLPPGEVNELRAYGGEDYVIVSPYPGQDAPVTVTSWRVQLELNGAGDPRLREFVDDFRISELAPLSGNRCEGGVGNPTV